MVFFRGNMMPMSASGRSRLQIVILAAGRSSRLGTPKALARVHGISLLRRTLLTVDGLSAMRTIVVHTRNSPRHFIEARSVPCRFVINPRAADGLSRSVRLAMKFSLHSPGVLLLPVDLAGLRRRDLQVLISRWLASRRRIAARRLGSHAATPLILPRWLFARASALSGDRGLRELVSALPAHTRVLLDLPSAASDVDTPQDLRAARRVLRGLRTPR